MPLVYRFQNTGLVAKLGQWPIQPVQVLVLGRYILPLRTLAYSRTTVPIGNGNLETIR